jgi:hypothetical protein
MRKADLQHNHVSFDEALARYRSFMQKIVGAQRVVSTAQEKRDIAESVILRLCANWESFLDEHLVDCINVDHSQLSEYFGATIPPNPSKALCQALLFGGSYRDFKSFSDLKGFSKKPLPQASNPFLVITVAQSARIDEAYKIRNYLSHYSAAGRRALLRVYQQQYGMTRFLEPGQFLLAYNGRRLWGYFDAFEAASAAMKAWYTRP